MVSVLLTSTSFSLFFSLLLYTTLSSNVKSGGVCISPGGRFPPFPFEGHPPRKATKGPKDLTLCRVFRKRTCCDITQTYPALVSLRKLSSLGEASEECLHLWELLECSICDPHVGVRQGPPVICASLCNAVFQSCSSAYFAFDGKTQVLSPCGSRDILCSKASEFISNGSDLCRLAGFSVKQSTNAYHITEDSFCYGGKATFDSTSDSWRHSESESSQEAQNFGMLTDFLQWTSQMSFSERVSWAVGGLVLTAGLFFFSLSTVRLVYSIVFVTGT
ncbi:hypothetical protein EJ110_NYTH34642 [Nymphaea thermarum]|nr:hypothetical protein EJ110_NYTH34642 [Nymphaea thermarum]